MKDHGTRTEARDKVLTALKRSKESLEHTKESLTRSLKQGFSVGHFDPDAIAEVDRNLELVEEAIEIVHFWDSLLEPGSVLGYSN